MSPLSTTGALDPAMLMSLHGRQAPQQGVPKTPEAARAAAEDFEAFFVTQMLESMYAGVKTDGMFGGGHAEGVYRSMMLDNYGREVAARGGLGIADMVVKQMLALQEAGTTTSGDPTSLARPEPKVFPITQPKEVTP